jgi:hypothetical protein
MTHTSKTLIERVLGQRKELANAMSLSAFATDTQKKGEQVRLYRDYQNGEHRNFLTEKQRKLINLPPAIRSSREKSITVIGAHDFNANYCDKIVSTVASRTKVSGIIVTGKSDSDSEKLNNEWLKPLLDFNRFDASQGKVYRSSYGDRESFVLAEWDDENKIIRWTVEPAYNGSDGLIVKFNADNQTILFAIKIWHLADDHGVLSHTRINVYYPDRIERYTSSTSGNIEHYPDRETYIIPWEFGVVPIAPFINRGVAYSAQGKSEIEDVIGLQDALNYALYNMTASSTLSGFGVWKNVGYRIPTEVQPGMVFSADRREIDSNGNVIITPPIQSDGNKTYFAPDLERISGDGPTPYVEQANWIIEQISVITDTPIPQLQGGSGESGEALKQRETGLVSKIKDSQINFGNSWEFLVVLSHAIHNANVPLPDIESVSIRWEPAETRSAVEVITNVTQLSQAGLIDQKTALEAVSFVFGWSVDDITTIMERTNQANNSLLFGGNSLIPGIGF